MKTGGVENEGKMAHFPYKFRLKTADFQWLLEMEKFLPNPDFFGFSGRELQNASEKRWFRWGCKNLA